MRDTREQGGKRLLLNNVELWMKADEEDSDFDILSEEEILNSVTTIESCEKEESEGDDNSELSWVKRRNAWNSSFSMLNNQKMETYLRVVA